MVFFPVSLSTKLLLSYTKATDSYTLILYSVTLLEVIIRLKCFLVEYLGSCKYIFCHLQIQKVSCFAFQPETLLFISLILLL